MLKEYNDLFTKLNIPKIKLSIPQNRHQLISRKRLLDILDQGVKGKLSLVCAPAGSGKTILASEWVAHSGLPVAWVSLESLDDDFSRFWNCILASMNSQRPELWENMAPVLHTAQPTFFQPFVVQLLNELYTQDAELFLILDDYHLIENPQIHASFSYFLERLPTHLHCMILSRTEPPLPLSRFATRNEMLRLDAADLHFTIDECDEYYRMMKLNLPAAYIREIQQRTEGWIAGLKLAALSLQKDSDTQQLLHSLTGNYRHISDYLFEEVFSLQGEQVRSFLEQTSMLNRMSAPLCEYITGLPESQYMIEQLERANVFMIPLDETRTWFRYHHLFAEFLQGRLSSANEELYYQLHLRAAEWFEKESAFVEAVEHYLAGKHQSRAFDLIERILPDMIGRNWETLYRWFSALPVNKLQEKAELYFTWLFLATAKEDWATVLPNMPKLEAYLASHASIWSEQETNRYSAYLHLIKSYLAVCYSADLEAAATHSRAYFQYASAASLHHIDVDTGDISIVRVFGGIKGRLQKAEPFFLEMIAIWEHVQTPFTGIFHIGRAEVLYEWNRLDEAEKEGRRGFDIGKVANSGKVMAPAAVLLSNIYARKFSIKQAVDFLEQTIYTLRNNRFHFWADILESQIVRLNIHQMTPADLTTWWKKCSWLLSEDLSPATLFQAITLVRVLISLERWDEASYWLDHMLRLTELEGRLGERIELLVLQSMLCQRRKQMKQALLFVLEALGLAEPEGYIRLFLNERRELGELLSLCLYDEHVALLPRGSAKPSPVYLKRLEDHFGREQVSHAKTSSLTGMDSLTNKEREVLYMLAEGLPTRQIAERMCVTVGTVKTHLHRIYQKLQVKGRWEAIESLKQSWLQ